MENKLGDFVIKFLKDKTETRKIIKCDDFFQLVNDMGINDNSDEIVDIIYYLEDNKIDINFHGAKTQDYYNRFRNIERKVQISKMLKGSKTEVQKLIEKVDNVKIQERPDWLDYYRNDDDETPNPISDRDSHLGQRIIDRLTSEIKDRLDDEPKITLEEVQQMVDIERGFNDEQIEQLRNAPEITEEQMNEIRNNN